LRTVTLKYGTTTQAYQVLWIRGMDDPEEMIFWPPVVERRIDGSLYENFRAYQRVISINFGVIQDASLRDFIFTWLKQSEKKIILDSEELAVVLEKADRFSNTWNDNLETERAFQVRVIEKTARSTHPTSWT